MQPPTTQSRTCHRTEFCSSSAAQRAVASSSCARSSISAVVGGPPSKDTAPPDATPPSPDAMAGCVAASCQASTSALAASPEDVDCRELESPVAMPFEFIGVLIGSGSSSVLLRGAGPAGCGCYTGPGPRPSKADPRFVVLICCTAFRDRVSPVVSGVSALGANKEGGGGSERHECSKRLASPTQCCVVGTDQSPLSGLRDLRG
jgi:hypothetical protein